MSPDLVKELLTSPVLVAAVPALITGVISVFFGRLMLQSKDEQIKTKDEQITTLKAAHAAELKAKEAEIAAAQWWTPAKMKEQVEAAIQINQMNTEVFTAALRKAEEDLTLTESQRSKLEAELDTERAKRVDVQAALEAILASLTDLERKGVWPANALLVDWGGTALGPRIA